MPTEPPVDVDTHLPADTPAEARAALRAAGRTVVGLRRRGVHHGFVALAATEPAIPADAADRWQQARPIPLPGAVAAYLEAAEPLIDDTLQMFERLRRGRRFLHEVEERMERADDDALAPAGCTVDLLDARAVEKVWVHANAGDESARDLWAKLSWIADDESDLSLRIAFSSGDEGDRTAVEPTDRAIWADHFAEQVFPECAIVSDNRELLDLIATFAGADLRCSERIVYSNAPGGGAVFHQDVDPGQCGVVFSQLAGWSAWLALPKRELARIVADHIGGDRAAVLRALEDPDEALWRTLNRDPGLTARLVAAGAFFALRPGDVLLLPTVGPDDVAWHSVFALGQRPGLGHSYGLFPAAADE